MVLTKSKLLNLKSKLFSINDAPRIALSYAAIIAVNMVGGIWLRLLNQTTTSNQETINSLMSETSIISSFFVVVLVCSCFARKLSAVVLYLLKLFEGYEKIGYVFWLAPLYNGPYPNKPTFFLNLWLDVRRPNLDCISHQTSRNVYFPTFSN